MQVEDGDVAGKRHLALRDCGEHIALARPVVAEQPVSAALRELQVAVGHKLLAADSDTKRLELDITRCSGRREHTSYRAVARDALLPAQPVREIRSATGTRSTAHVQRQRSKVTRQRILLGE